MRFRLVLYDTDKDNKFEAEFRYEYFGNQQSIWNLWWLLTNSLHKKHVEVFNLAGTKCNPGRGEMPDYNV